MFSSCVKNNSLIKPILLTCSLIFGGTIATPPAYSLLGFDKRPATCLVQIKNEKIIHGACSFKLLNKTGSFLIEGQDIVEGQNVKYSAYLYVDKTNKSTATSAIAKSVSGRDGLATPIDRTLHRNEGCWLNEVLKICAYEKASAPDEIRNQNETIEQIRDFYENSSNGNSVISLQKRLSELRYYKGELDNIWGTQMYQAMEEAIANINKEGTKIAFKDENAMAKFLKAISNPIDDGQSILEPKELSMSELEKQELNEAEIDIIESREAIRLVGIDVGMTELLQRKILTRDGYICKDSICKKQKARVILYEDRIVFNCDNFNVCHLSFKELAEDLVNNNIVEDMEYNTSSYVQFNILTYVETYCGRGDAGDSLCVRKETEASGHVGENLLVLKKGALGKGGSTYN